MSQTKRKTTSVSLTIGSSVKETSSSSVRQSSSTLIQPLSIDPKKVQSPPSSHSGATPGVAPTFTKCLQNISTAKGQLVVFECRIRATPPLQVHWYREHHPIIDSADFRILRKKACLSAVPEEVCTLVITEAYPEDSGVFKCIAENDYGCLASSAHLSVYPEFSDNDLLDDHQYAPVSDDDAQNTYYPKQTQNVSANDAAEKPTFGAFRQMTKQDNVMANSAFANDDLETIEGFEAVSDSSPEPEPSSEWYSQLPERDYTSHQNISSAKQAGQGNREDYSTGDLSTSTAKDSSSTSTSQTRQGASCVSVTNLPSLSSVRPPSMFNYERPKHFIQAQPACPAQSLPQGTGTPTYVPKSPQNENYNFSEQPLSPSSSSVNSPKYFSSSSFPSTMDPAHQATTSAPQNSTGFTQGQKASYPYNQSPAAFLTSVLPSHQDHTNNNKTPVTMESRYFEPTYKKMPKQPQPTSDHQIQGTKDALIQDLERKLRCKDNLLQNGNQRLTYEERMARRLLGRENAASVFDIQNEDGLQDSENPDNQGMQGQGTLERSRHSSRGEETPHRSIQEKLFPPRFLTIPGDLEIEEGRFCRIDFKVTGLPAPDVTWYLNGRPVRNDDFHKMIVSEKGFHSFIFEVVRLSDAGEYVCTATNRAGKATFRMQLDVLAHERQRMPSFIHKPQSARAMEGDSVRIECQVSAVPPPQILLKKNNEMLHYNTDRISLLQDSNGKISLLIYNVSKKDDGWYTISAVNEAGVATCHARIDIGIRVKPTISKTKPLKVRPTFSMYSILNGRGVEDRADEDFPQTEPSYPGLYESEEL